MNHIKYFKLFESSNEFYEIMEGWEDDPWSKLGEAVDMSKQAGETLKDKFNNRLLKGKLEYVEFGRFGSSLVLMEFRCRISVNEIITHIDINEFEDSYFLVNIYKPNIPIGHDVLAKCDQLDGVIKFLEDYEILQP